MIINKKSHFIKSLKKGDLLRVISFGLSLKDVSIHQRKICNKNLKKLGLRVSLGSHVEKTDEFGTSSVMDRIEDLNEALINPKVKLILSGVGGMNTAQILKSINWILLKNNPKIYCGFSDITVLLNAIYAKTGIVTYYGPFYGTFGMKKGIEYTLKKFKKCLFSKEPFILNFADSWSDDFWWFDQDNRKFISNLGPLIINEGKAKGKLVGGHLTSFSTLFGTEFMPDLSGSILMIEENGEIRPRSFDRLLQSLIHQKGFNKVKAILIGRFTSTSQINEDILIKIIRNHPELSSIPIVANLNFGHTYPQFTFPIGGVGQINAKKGNIIFEILNH